MNLNVLGAIFKRNFVSYFSNPTGYVFICVFVLLSSFAAFWPNEFFNSNLANLDQLNQYLPYIMLVFIPAITMSIWAEERRLGTDELLLTIPAGDLEVVLGKFLAALAIFSVALVFSAFSNFCVLGWLGAPDMGLFFGTYVGYWMIGMAMISMGMVASFLTGNLTVGFTLGAVFNAPLVFLANADVIVKSSGATLTAVKQWSLSEQFRDFSRGVLSLSSMSYFIMITVVMLYLSVVLIGRRHWLGGRDGPSMVWHYLARTLALIAIAVGVNFFFSNHDWIRADVTSERLSSLSPDTRRLIKDLDAEYPIEVEAYVSPEVPPEYVTTKLNLLSVLDEFDSLGGGKINVQTHILEPFSEEARLAEEKYDITPQRVLSMSRGLRTEKEIFLGVAVRSGLEKVVVPFLDKGVPPEYELIRSIATVSQPERKKIGVIRTDAELFGGFDMQRMAPNNPAQLIVELQKQYEVEQVDPSQPISDEYDVLLAVQPSTLGPQEMQNFIAAVKTGQPTAIFEDPFPLPGYWGSAVGTSQPRRPPQQMAMFGGRQPPPPKGDITELWKLLGVDFVDDQVVWQDYNPTPKGDLIITPEWVFVDAGSGNEKPFNENDQITSGLQQLLFLFPGSLRKLNKSKLEFEDLASTGDKTGTIELNSLMQNLRGGPQAAGLTYAHEQAGETFPIAVRIKGKLPVDRSELLDPSELSGDKQSSVGADAFEEVCQVEGEPDATVDDGPTSDEDDKKEDGDEKAAPVEPEVNVVLVADIDFILSAFFQIRARGQEEDNLFDLDVDNVVFALNIIDELAGEKDFLEIRKRRRAHRTLTTIDARTEEARQRAVDERKTFNQEQQQARDDAEAEFQKRISEIQQREGIGSTQRQIQLAMARADAQRRRDVKLRQLEQKSDRQLKDIDRELTSEIRQVQDEYKLWAVLVPPIPPLLVAFFVFFHRRQQEREGVAKSRLR